MKYIEKQRTDEEIQYIIDEFCLMDDLYFNVFMDSNPQCMEVLLRAIIKRDDIQVIEMHTQHQVNDLVARGVRFDVYCKDSDGTVYDFEIQNEVSGASAKRGRYYSSMLDVMHIKKGDSFETLPKSYVILLVDGDALNSGAAICKVYRTIESKNHERYLDDSTILYVDCSRDYDISTDFGKVMHDMKCKDPQNMLIENLRDRAKFVKSYGKERLNMGGILDIYLDKKLNEGINIGLARGEAKGLAEGLAEGEARGNSINSWLARNNRTEELIKSFDDSVLRSKLVAEYDAAHL